MESLYHFALQNVGFDEFNFKRVIVCSVINLALWISLPFLQLKYGLISKICGNDKGRACDFVAFALMNMSCLRNYFFVSALMDCKQMELGTFGYILSAIGLIMIIQGSLYLVSAFWALGIKGTYFGPHFGLVKAQNRNVYPFNVVEFPLHTGFTLYYLGMSFLFLSPSGLALTLAVKLTFYLMEYFELKQFSKLQSD